MQQGGKQPEGPIRGTGKTRRGVTLNKEYHSVSQKGYLYHTEGGTTLEKVPLPCQRVWSTVKAVQL